MNIHRKPCQHYPFPVESKPMFLIYDTEGAIDAHVCRDADDVRDTIKQCDLLTGPFIVLEIEVGQKTYDVTADFIPDEADEGSTADIPSPEELYRQHMARVV